MSDPNPTPQWYTPGGATTAQREPAGHPTAPIPVHGSTPPPGPFGPGRRSARRRAAVQAQGQSPWVARAEAESLSA